MPLLFFIFKNPKIILIEWYLFCIRGKRLIEKKMKFIVEKKTIFCAFAFLFLFSFYPLFYADSTMRINRHSVFVDTKLKKHFKKRKFNNAVVILKNSESKMYSGINTRLAEMRERLSLLDKKIAGIKRKLASNEKTEKKNAARKIKKINKLRSRRENIERKYIRISKSINRFIDARNREKIEELIFSIRGDNKSHLDLIPKRKFRKIPALSCVLSRRGFRKLKKNPSIFSIYKNFKVSAFLDVSAPLIKADRVHSTMISGKYLDGSGETIAVIDSGIDYTHPAFESCQPQPFITISSESPYLLESQHNYQNNLDKTWVITATGNSNTAVYFNRVELERGYDFLYIMDGNDNVIQKLTGNDNSQFWSRSVQGEVIKIRLVTDYDINYWGFKISKVADAVTNETPFTNCTKVIGGYDFVSDDFDPYDDNGHGTHVSGIIASVDSTYKGIAPGAKIVALKVLDRTGNGESDDVAAAIEWCVNNKDIYNISVINLSLGDNGQYASSAYCDQFLISQMINLAVSNGIFVAVASGNNGYTSGISLPACASGATSVGGVYTKDWGKMSWSSGCTDATTAADKIVCHTNRSSLLDLLAPGAVIQSSVPGGGFGQKSGTSMATPHIAGVAALVQQNEKLMGGTALSPSDLTVRLKNTGKSIVDSSGTGLTFRRVDAYSALGWTANCGGFYEGKYFKEYKLQGESAWDSILKILNGSVTLINLSSKDLYETRVLIYDISDSSITVLEPDGYMNATIGGKNYKNIPYYYYGNLSVGESFAKLWKFHDPQIRSFSFKATLFSKDCP
ncbi:MAG: hypothetical protein D6734_06210 [Candidatus Schekmanbacteria bacterium]|nr:MAG: hypothetical protein D6734_06210 [Candidatus Schekmanbacteria bacterium]